MTTCLICGHPAEDHQNLIATCGCGCTARRFGATPHGVPRGDLDRLLDAVKHAAAVVAEARADTEAWSRPQASGAAVRVSRAALDRVAATLDAALEQANAATGTGSYSDRTPVSRKVYDPLDGTEITEIVPPPHQVDR
ncbi:hypothetical protein [Mycolicibacterium hippocampi]|uniref:Uncharacterized protein n=1 Tax=Mycolicibacterium hippocampi TaxID=659824 RepID=A0A7I9ZRT3_9MYCO|nr:hypothetical protein [Mycolicibacterium hippocampi]GFH03386.1 hypothetical protein MHIP_38690 [Mycolicibacterium hippocampi]